MNWLDKAINFISPKWGAKREGWRAARATQDSFSAELRNYQAADISRLTKDFQAVNMPADMEDNAVRDLIRARARYLEKNSDIMRALLSAIVRNVLGSGFQLQSRTKNERLNTQLEQNWAKWCRARNCDVTGQQSLMQMLRMVITRKAVDGGVLIVKRYTQTKAKDPNRPFLPFQLQLVEVDQLATVVGSKDARVVNGIEYNEYNRPIAYYIQPYEVEGTAAVDPIRVLAKDVIFYRTKHRPTQSREISDLTNTILRIDSLDRYIQAEEVKHKIMACLSVFITTESPSAFAGRGTKTDPDTYGEMTLAPGVVNYLKPGEEPKIVNPTGTASDFAVFVRQLLHMICAGQGMSYETGTRDLSGTNYSSARQGAIEDGLAFAEDIEQIIEILDEIYETFVISCVQNHQVNLKTEKFWNHKDDYLAHEWIKQPKPWIDPVKEANATKIALETGIKTPQQVCGENGEDWRDHIRDWADALKYAQDEGFDLGALMCNGKITFASEDDAQKSAKGTGKGTSKGSDSLGKGDPDTDSTDSDDGSTNTNKDDLGDTI